MTARGLAAGALLLGAALALAPAPGALWRDDPVRRPGAWLDPALRAPFASVLLRAAEPPALAPGERVLGVRLPGDRGLLVPRGRDALLAALAGVAPGETVALRVRGPGGEREVRAALRTVGARRALAEQWPAALAGALLLLFAGVCAIGGRHPVATPLAAVTACLGAGVLAALDLALPGDGGVLGVAGLRGRTGALAWSLLPAALLHLAARFPVAMPRFRRPGLAALPWALWAAPAALAQLRFGEAAVGQAVERVALTASFLAGAILVAGCLRPGRALTPIERFRARAATAGLVAAGAGPLAAFASGAAPGPAASTALALGALALPAALGWAVARYRLLDPPGWVPRVLLGAGSALAALGLAGVALHGLARVAPAAAGAPALALATALLYQALQVAFARLAARAAGRRRAAPEALVARAARELAGLGGTSAVLARLAAIVREGLGAGALAVGAAEGGPGARSALLRRGTALCAGEPSRAGVALAQAPRREDPDPLAPELALRLEPRRGAPVVVAVGPRPDGLPYAPEEARALADVGRLAALSLADALDAAALEEQVAARTAALRRALDDRTALVAAAERIQAAGDATAVRAAVAAFLGGRSGAPVRAGGPSAPGPGRVVTIVCRPPAGREALSVSGLSPERAADLQPQAEALGAFADVALERLHGLDGLKREVEQQARELARLASGRRHAEFARRAAHELRKPGEEIRHLVAALAQELPPSAREGLRRIDVAACELGRRLDTLLTRQGRRLDARRVDLVRLVDEAVRRVALGHPARRFPIAHERPRLPLVGDPVQLASLVENLVDNAVRASAEDAPVAVRTRFLARPGAPRGVALEVEDAGCGIAPDLGEEIFEPGVGAFRGGLGLGLALCREVAALHRGEIEVESQPGRTLFRVVLPQLPAEAEA